MRQLDRKSRTAIRCILPWCVMGALAVACKASGDETLLEATQDNFGLRLQPNTVQDPAGLLLVKGENDSFIYKIWISFTVSNIQRPVTESHFRISLKGTNTTGDQLFDVYGLANETIDTWSEETLTWNNAPANSLSGNGFLSDAVLVGSFWVPSSWTDGDTFEVASQQLVDLINADTDGRLSILIRRRTIHFGGHWFYSSELGEPGVSTPRLFVRSEGPVDFDEDGLTDDEEADIGTDPGNADTDADGLLDGIEVNTSCTDPLNPDTDGDQLLDGEEVNITGTDPCDPDTDADEVPDNIDPHPLVVTPAQELKNSAIDAVEILLAEDDGDDDLIQAIGYLHMSLGEDDERAGMSGSQVIWLDGNHVEPLHGEDAFQYEQEACDKLDAYLLNDANDDFDFGDEIEVVLLWLAYADHMLAETAIDDAIAENGNWQDITDALLLLDEGDAAREQGGQAICDVALDKYEESWEKAIESWWD